MSKLILIIFSTIAIKNPALANNSFIEIASANADLLQCNMRCISNSECVAFTKQRANDVCKLHRFSTNRDSEDDYAVLTDEDTTMFVTRGSSKIHASTVNQSHFNMEDLTTTKASTLATNLIAISATETTTTVVTTATNTTTTAPAAESNTTESTIVESTTTESTIAESTTTESTIAVSSTTEATMAEISTTEATIEESNTTVDTQPTTTTDEPTETTMLSTATTTKPVPANLPKKNDYECTAIDDLEDNYYLIFWQVGKPFETKKAVFTVAKKSNLSDIVQEDDVNKVFPMFSSNQVSVAFNFDGITYLYAGTTWLKYRIELDADGKIASANHYETGGVNTFIKTVKAATNIDKYILFEDTVNAFSCIHQSFINKNVNPEKPENGCLCKIIRDLLQSRLEIGTYKSLCGYDSSSFRIQIANKLQPLN